MRGNGNIAGARLDRLHSSPARRRGSGADHSRGDDARRRRRRRRRRGRVGILRERILISVYREFLYPPWNYVHLPRVIARR